jgi:muconolactone delta-isomerase
MRHVFTNHEIPHLWAHQTQADARNGTGSFYFRGATIYSYGSHFPIATHVKGSQGQPGILFTSEKNSVTTSQHISAVRRSIPPDVPVFTVPCQHFGFSEAEDQHQHERNFKHYVDEVADNLSTCMRARASWKKEYCHDQAVELRKEALYYPTFFDLPDPPIEQIPDLDSEQMQKIKAREVEASNRKAAETKRKREEDRIRWQQAAEEWRSGEYHHYLPYDLPTMLRIEGHEVVTSRGVRFPITHARRALALVRAVMARGEMWQRNGHSCHLGHYTIDRIESDGTVLAGCHIVSWTEIERIAPAIEAFREVES